MEEPRQHPDSHLREAFDWFQSDRSEVARQALEASAGGRAALRFASLLYEAVDRAEADTPPQSLVKAAQTIGRAGVVSRFKQELEQFTGSIDAVLGSLLFDSRIDRLAEAYRGSTEMTQISFSSELCELDLEVGESQDGWLVHGQLSCDDTASSWALEVVSASRDELRRVFASAVSSDLSFEFSVPDGAYFFLLKRGGVLVEFGPLVVP